MSVFNDRYNEYLTAIEKAIIDYMPDNDCLQKSVMEAMNYSIQAGGKRIRPVLVLEFMRACGGDYRDALPFAVAIEMIHTYSLIHDDLPCMDNDDFRRGKPSCHKAFDEATALLAGDGLLTLAFETALTFTDFAKISYESAVKALKVLANAVGVNGMIGGQLLDLESEDKIVSKERLNRIYDLKTGAMLTAAVQIGCILAVANEKIYNTATEYSEKIGLSFQIVDDILDVTGDEKSLGKPIGSDAQNHKSTYVTLYGLHSAQNIAIKLTDKAKKSLQQLPNIDSFLFDLTDMLTERNH